MCVEAAIEEGAEEINVTRHIETVHGKRRDHACPYCQGVAFGSKSYA